LWSPGFWYGRFLGRNAQTAGWNRQTKGGSELHQFRADSRHTVNTCLSAAWRQFDLLIKF
jgi:hypothetical protein